MLVTVGGTEAAAWAFGTWAETHRLQPSIRPVACMSAAFCPTPCLGRAQVLLCAKSATLWAADLLSSGVGAGETHAVLDMTAMLEAPKPVKLYCMGVHPLQPGLLAVGTNAGLVVLNLGVCPGRGHHKTPTSPTRLCIVLSLMQRPPVSLQMVRTSQRSRC
jgi:hypothetical protein